MSTPTSLRPDLTGSFSSPAGGNPTGVMVEAAYQHHSINARYINCEVGPTALAAAVAGARAMGWIGFNCSLPHKEAIIPLLDEVAPSAAKTGAVNTVVVRKGRLVGENTDGRGFVQSLSATTELEGKFVTILGAGGAARAIAVELTIAGAAAIHLISRDTQKAVDIASILHDFDSCSVTLDNWVGDAIIPPATSILVNATPVGLAPETGAAPAVNLQALREGTTVCDVVPNPARTLFLRMAQERGARTIDGRGMLTNQAAINIQIWTGVKPDLSVMRARLDEVIGESGASRSEFPEMRARSFDGR